MSEKSKSPPFVTELKDESSIKKLFTHLKQSDFLITQPAYTRFQAKKKGISCTLYNSGKLVLMGKEASTFIEFYLEPEILQDFSFTYKKLNTDLNLDLNLDLNPRIGVDESGKGDFFGALCVAGVYADGESVKKLIEIGAVDSKILKDPAIVKIAKKIRENIPHHIIRLNPHKYNELYAKFKNLNLLLGWCHATIIEELVKKTGCQSVIIDQFASKGLMEGLIKKKNLEITLNQRTKAEEDVVVAAASILARAAFVEGIENLEKQFDMTLPKGASAKVIQAGKQFVNTFGAQELSKVSKIHFKTTDKLINRGSSE